jgi:hypothetical protein
VQAPSSFLLPSYVAPAVRSVGARARHLVVGVVVALWPQGLGSSRATAGAQRRGNAGTHGCGRGRRLFACRAAPAYGKMDDSPCHLEGHDIVIPPCVRAPWGDPAEHARAEGKHIEFMFGGNARLSAPVPRDGVVHYSHGVRQVRRCRGWCVTSFTSAACISACLVLTDARGGMRLFGLVGCRKW